MSGRRLPDAARLSAVAARHKRTYNVHRVKATWPYTVQEIAELFGIHKNAVLRWLKDGLGANKDQRPFLIRGEELIRFLNARQRRKRCKCAITEFYCFKCRGPRGAYLGIADVAIESPTRIRVSSLCAVCDTPINKVQSVRDLERIRSRFHVQQLTGEHILDRDLASLNSDMETSVEHA
jgi:excisionase family DNA binding protein